MSVHIVCNSNDIDAMVMATQSGLNLYVAMVMATQSGLNLYVAMVMATQSGLNLLLW